MEWEVAVSVRALATPEVAMERPGMQQLMLHAQTELFCTGLSRDHG